jgi:hypothetical protein
MQNWPLSWTICHQLTQTYAVVFSTAKFKAYHTGYNSRNILQHILCVHYIKPSNFRHEKCSKNVKWGMLNLTLNINLGSNPLQKLICTNGIPST